MIKLNYLKEIKKAIKSNQEVIIKINSEERVGMSTCALNYVMRG